MDNIAFFNMAVGEILGRCYKSFPLPVEMSRADIGFELTENKPGYREEDGFNLNNPEYEIAKHTITWLRDSDFIRLEALKPNYPLPQLASLTTKSFSLLIDQKKNGNTVGELLSDGIRLLGIDAHIDLVKEVLSKAQQIPASRDIGILAAAQSLTR